MSERSDELNDNFVKKVVDYMDFSDIIQYPFVFVEVGIWD
jgi:hypothetical protein